MRIAPMPTAPPTAQTALNRVGIVDAPLAPEELFAPFGDVVLMGVPSLPFRRRHPKHVPGNAHSHSNLYRGPDVSE
jgi:hypothetical protein